MSIKLMEKARLHCDRTAIVAPEGVFSYRQLLDASARVAAFLLDGSPDLRERPVAFLTPPGFRYVALQWGIWRAGGIAVPLSVSHPRPELEYVLADTEPSAVLADSDFVARLQPSAETLSFRFARAVDALEHAPGALPDVAPARRAMILYTSGTTGRPKGVVLTHLNLTAQIESLVKAWEWNAGDHILEFLPLHHIHGIVNVISCALRAGAVCEILPAFDAHAVWERIGRGGLTLFMAVPTIYAKLIDAWRSSSPADRQRFSEGCRRMRLLVSGSAALPVSILEMWREISGHVLLERYGMTEIGMALSNPLHGMRVPGAVGTPLPGVDVRLVDDAGKPVAPGTPGEIEVRGETVFSEYWRRPEDNRQAFRDGWFQTGDVAVFESGSYRILGRNSVDIIKTGGEKVSALEIESILLTYPAIRECAVVGIPDPIWGEKVCAALVPEAGQEPDTIVLRAWLKERLAPYKAPKEIAILRELPRNAMGKLIKAELKKFFQLSWGRGDDKSC